MPGTTPTAVSAPGKVFLAGGYLVLDQKYTALVFGLSARINAIAKDIETSQGVQIQEIVVNSPQFPESQWRYGYHLTPEQGGTLVTQFQVGSKINANPFVETTLSYVLTYISTVAGPNLSLAPVHLTVLADNDYYSQPDSMHNGTGGAQATGRFAKFPTPLKDANKTGLGSSAAIVTSLTAALLTHYLPKSLFDVATDEGKRVLHNLAQAAHCAAQGKVGSGFDIAAAVYGSCRYRRFSPSLLSNLPAPGTAGFAPALARLVASADWDYEISKEGVALPPGVALRMCDVDCGSQTVGMVKKVLAWKEKEPAEAKTLMDTLQTRNVALGEILASGQKEGIVPAVEQIRELIRAMGAQSDVPIEPESQTALLDALKDVEGVYNGVVPGAGGFDAVALLMDDDAATEQRLRDYLQGWSKQHNENVRLLNVKGELEGVRVEGLKEYEGWL